MSVETDIYGYLTGLTSITAEYSTRIYPQLAPTSATFPYCTFQRISHQHDHHLTGSSGLARAVFQFDTFDNTQLAAWTAAETLRSALDGYQEGILDGVGTTDVRSILLQNEREDVIPPADDSEKPVFNVSQDFEFFYRESIPTFPAT